ncbi:uncharacterized protein LOC142527993 [Primulina tabacum]|uniref:uncharacterized protein LOC142527993 n=1 Tax=Primulina tabacum TaxID=48773 RepID=UPI003F5A4120
MERLMENLTLSTDEDEEIIIEENSTHQKSSDLEFCLIGRFLTDRSINFNAMKNRMASIWRPGKGICIKELEGNLYLFQFFHTIDLKRVLDGGPWSFDNHLLVLHKMKSGEIPSLIPLNSADFWVQVYDLPIGFMSEHIGKLLGNFIGKFVTYDISNNSSIWRTFMRIRVTVDVSKPLKRFKKIRKQGEDWTIVNFKYERFTQFCFICGLLGHTDRFCDKLFTILEDDIKKKWGIWLRAPIRKNTNTEGSRWLRDDDSIVMHDNTNEGTGQGHEHRCGRRDNANLDKTLIGATQGWQLTVTDFNTNQRKNRADNKEDIKEASHSEPNQIIVHDSEEYIMDITEERKRRRGPRSTTESRTTMDLGSEPQCHEAHCLITNANTPQNYFLLAGSGSQACQDP